MEKQKKSIDEILDEVAVELSMGDVSSSDFTKGTWKSDGTLYLGKNPNRDMTIEEIAYDIAKDLGTLPETKSPKQQQLDNITKQREKIDRFTTVKQSQWTRELEDNEVTSNIGQSGIKLHSGMYGKVDEQLTHLSESRLAKSQLDQAEKTLKTYTERDNDAAKRVGKERSGFSVFMDGFTNQTFEDVIGIATLDIPNTANASRINSILEKASKGERLSETERLVLESFGMTREAARYVEDSGGATVGDMAGSGSFKSLGYLTNLSMTSGGRVAAKAATKWGAKSILGKLGDAALQEAARLPLMGSAYNTFQNNKTNQYALDGNNNVTLENEISFWNNVYRSAVSTYSENISEQVGNIMPTNLLLKGLKKITPKGISTGLHKIPPKILGARAAEAMGDFIGDNLQRTQALRDVFKRNFNYNGLETEWFEEQISGILEPVLTGDFERIKDLFDSKTQQTILASTLALNTAFNAATLPSAAMDLNSLRKMRKGINTEIANISDPELRQGVFDILKSSKPIEDVAGAISKLTDWSKVGKEDLQNIMGAYIGKVEYDVFKGFDEVKQAETVADDRLVKFNNSFGVFRNHDTGMVHRFLDRDGNLYFQQAGKSDQDGVVFVRDVNGKLMQMPEADLKPASAPFSYEDGAREILMQLSQQVEQESARAEREEAVENVVASNVVANDYEMDDEIEIEGGKTARFIKYNHDDTQTAEVAFIDNETGDEISETILQVDIIRKINNSQDSQQPVNSENTQSQVTDSQQAEDLDEVQSVQEPVVEQPQIPLLKDGTPDYEAMSPYMFVKEYGKKHSEQEALEDLKGELSMLESEISKSSAKVSINRNERAKNRDRVSAMRTKADEIRAYLAQIEPTTTTEQRPSFAADEQISTKYTQAPKEYGTERAIYTPGNEKVDGRYVLLESGTVTPSHDARSFQPSVGFPQDENGSTVNDRDYSKDTEAQRQVVMVANAYNGRALDNPVVVSPDGIVVSGNNRTMSGELAAAQGTDSEYVEHLKNTAAQYGFTPDQIANFTHPRIVFETKETPAYNTETFAKFNAQETKTQNKVERAVRIGKTIAPSSIKRIANIIDEHETLGDFYGDKLAIAQTLKTLQNDGVINANEIAELKDGDNLSTIGKDMVETLMVGSVLSEDAVRLVNRDGMRKYRNRITKAILPIVENSTLGEYSIADALSEAVTILDRARNQRGTVDGVTRQLDAFEQIDYSPESVAIAKALEGSSERGLRDLYADYNRAAAAPATGQRDLLTGGVQTKQEILQAMGVIPANATEPITEQPAKLKLSQEVEAEVQRLNKISPMVMLDSPLDLLDIYGGKLDDDGKAEIHLMNKSKGYLGGIDNSSGNVYAFSDRVNTVKKVRRVWLHETTHAANAVNFTQKDLIHIFDRFGLDYFANLVPKLYIDQYNEMVAFGEGDFAKALLVDEAMAANEKYFAGEEAFDKFLDGTFDTSKLNEVGILAYNSIYNYIKDKENGVHLPNNSNTEDKASREIASTKSFRSGDVHSSAGAPLDNTRRTGGGYESNSIDGNRDADPTTAAREDKQSSERTGEPGISRSTDPIADAKTPEERHKAVSEFITRMNETTKANVSAFSGIKELPEELQKKILSDPSNIDENGNLINDIDGFTFGGAIYISSPLMNDTKRAERTYIHEVVGHQFIDKLIKKNQREMLFDAVIDDIGIEHMLSHNIPELNEEIKRYQNGDISKGILGREYIAYLTEKYFTPEDLNIKSEENYVDLSKPITDNIIGNILKATNNGTGKIGIIPNRFGQRERLRGLGILGQNKQKYDTGREIETSVYSSTITSDGDSLGTQQINEGRLGRDGSTAGSSKNNTESLSEQEQGGTNHNQQGVVSEGAIQPRGLALEATGDRQRTVNEVSRNGVDEGILLQGESANVGSDRELPRRGLSDMESTGASSRTSSVYGLREVSKDSPYDTELLRDDETSFLANERKLQNDYSGVGRSEQENGSESVGDSGVEEQTGSSGIGRANETTINTENDVRNLSGDSQRDSSAGSNEVSINEGTVLAADTRGGRPVGDEVSGQNRGNDGQRPSSKGDSVLPSSISGERSDNGVSPQDRSQLGTEGVDARGIDNSGFEADNTRRDENDNGLGDANDAIPSRANGTSFEQRAAEARIKQKKAESIPAKVMDMDNIRQTLPMLLPEQQDDVMKAETRFYHQKHNTAELSFGKGMMFTNGTGTGKTFTGFGIIKRFHKLGKKDILIVVPAEANINDWTKEAKSFGLKTHVLESTKDEGEEISVTTFANFRANNALKKRELDLIVYDESHRLMESIDGKISATTKAHFQMCNRNLMDAKARIESVHPLWTKENQIRASLAKDGIKQSMVDDLTQRLERVKQQQKDAGSAIEEQAQKAVEKTKVVYLSATPFKSHFNLRYANGTLFNWDGDGRPERGSRIDAESAFMLDNFGANYEWKYHRLQSKSGSDAAALAMQEIEFADRLVESGIMSSRAIESNMDYSREFPLITLGRADIFNKGFNDLFSFGEGAKYRNISEFARKIFYDHNYSTQLYESLRASMSIDRIKQHLDLGRKIVVFHRRKQADTSPPFRASLALARKEAATILSGRYVNNYDRARAEKILEECNLFESENFELLNYEQSLDYSSAIDQITKAFGKKKVVTINGDTPKKSKSENIKLFNTDNSGVDIIVIQEESGKEGISLHDKSGKHQRVLMNMSLPVSSTTALQIEGRIYRIGQESNAIFEYPLLGLDMEIASFGNTINKKLSTTENLATGSQARDLMRSFSEGVFSHSSSQAPNLNQGVGGKEFDKRTGNNISEFERSILVYKTNQRNKSQRGQREGTDFYATPEPVGFKMVEMLNLKKGESVLEPSAGDGRIAMWFPKFSNSTIIEPSQVLFSKASVRSGGGNRKTINGQFEDFNIINKFDGIAMNPPFGKGGSTAIAHIEKAFSHLKENGRIVAIIPRGAMDKKFDEFLYEEDSRGNRKRANAHLVSSINLPASTFEQAGTSVATRIVVIDKRNSETASYPRNIDLSGIQNIKELFSSIENLTAPPRDGAIQDSSIDIEADVESAFEIFEQKHSKTGENLYTVSPKRHIGDHWKLVSTLAKANGGYYSSYSNKEDNISSGFIFKNSENAQDFRTAADAILIEDDVRFRETSFDDELADEMSRIESEAIERGDYMLAPNGEQSNLNERQWLLVRTKAFKDWFGDWEKAARIEKLRNSSIVEITGDEYLDKYELNRDSAKKYLKDELRGNYTIKDTNEIILLAKDGAQKVTSHSMGNESHLKSIAVIPSLIKNAIFITELGNSKSNNKYDSYRYYGVGLKIDGVDYTVKMTVGVDTNGNKYYDHSLTEIEKGKLIDKVGALSTTLPLNDKVALSEYKDNKLLEILQNSLSKTTDANGEPNLADIFEFNNEIVRYRDEQTLQNSISEAQKHHNWEQEQQRTYKSRQALKTEAAGVLQKLSEKFNTPIEIVATKAELPYKLRYTKEAFSGAYDRSNGQVYFVLDAIQGVEEAQRTFLHEVVAHKGIDGLMGAQNAAKFYEAVFDSLDSDTQTQLLKKHKTNSKVIAGDEMVAAMAEGDVTPDVMQRIVSAIRKFFREVLGMPLRISKNDIRYILWKSKNNLQRANNLSEVFRVLEEEKHLKANLYPKKKGLFDQIKDVATRYRETKTPQEINSQFNRDLLRLQSGSLPLTNEFYLGMPSEALLASGMPNLPIELSAERLLRKSNQSNHPFDLSNVENLPEAIANPIAVFDSKTQKGSKVLLTELSNGKKNFVVAIKTGVDNNSNIQILEVNSVRSLYPKNTQQILGWIAKDGLLQWVDKKKALDFLSTQWPNYIASGESSKSQGATAELGTRKSGIQNGDFKGDINADLSSATKVVENFENPISDFRFRDVSDSKVVKTPYRAAGDKNTIKSAGYRIQNAIQDSTIKVYTLQKEIKKRGGTIDATTNVYESLNHRDSRISNGIEKYNQDYIGPFLDFALALGKKIDNVSDYLLAKHSLERHQSGTDALSTEKNKWTQEHVQKLIEDFEKGMSAAHIDRFWSLWRNSTERILKIAVESGRMSMEQRRDILAKSWNYYVPLRGKDFDFEELINLSEVYNYSTRTTSSPASVTKSIADIKAKGRKSKADDPISTLMNMAALEIYHSETNKTRQSLLRLVRQYPEMQDLFKVQQRWYVKQGETWIEMEGEPDASVIGESNDARKAIRNYRVELRKTKDVDKILELEEKIEQKQTEITVTLRESEAPGYRPFGERNPTYEGGNPKEREVIVMKDGVKYTIELKDPEVAQSINGATDSVQKWLSKYVGWGTRFLAKLSTSKNLAFMVPNLARDAQSAIEYSFIDSDGSVVGLTKHLAGSWKILHRAAAKAANPLSESESLGITSVKDRKKLREIYGKDRVNDTLYDLFAANGGETGYVHLLSPEELQRKIRKDIVNSGRNAYHPKKMWGRMNFGIDYVANISENSVRYAAFMSQLDKGKNVFDAVTYAKKITVNFNRKGKYSKGLGALYMFFNAGIQGFVNQWSLVLNKEGKDSKTITKQRARFVASKAAQAVVGFCISWWLQSVLADMIGDDGEEFQISDYERMTNLIIPNGGKDYTKIPIPISFRPFYGLGVLTHNWVNGKIKSSDVLANFTMLMVNSSSPMPVDIDINNDEWGSWGKAIIPSLAKPFFELKDNRDFAGRQIYKSVPYNPNVPNSELGMYNVNGIAQTVSRWLNELGGGNRVTPAGVNEDGSRNSKKYLDLNPSMIEHIAKGYTGGIGKMFNDGIKFLTQGYELRHLPIVNRFAGSFYEKDPSKEYGDIKNGIEMISKNNKDTEELGIRSTFFTAEEFPAKKQEYKRLHQRIRNTEKRIRIIKEKMSETQYGTDEYKEYEKQIDKLQREFIKSYNNEQR